MDREILHCDCNAFFASVECVFNPALKNVPMVVAGNPDDRHGIILAKNEIAKKFGVKTAETVWQARKKCPGLVLVPPRHGAYSDFSEKVNNIYLRYTDMVEPFGIDESWLDVTGSRLLFGDGKTIADEIRETVKNELGLTVSVGVSFNKVFAKIGSDYKKPDATTVITRENYTDIVYPLPVSDLLYAGKSTCEALRKLGIFTIGDLAGADEKILVRLLGKNGSMLYRYARGEDMSAVAKYDDGEEIKSVGNSMTFRRDLVSYDEFCMGISVLSESVARRLRAKKLKCTTVQISVKTPDFKIFSKQKPLLRPTNLARDIESAAESLLIVPGKKPDPVRALSVTGMGLVSDNAPEQLLLVPDETAEKREKLETVIDEIKNRYGEDKIKPAGIMKNDIGIDE